MAPRRGDSDERLRAGRGGPPGGEARPCARVVFVGNLDPSGVLALGTPALVEEKTRELLAVFADTPRFILNSGCAIPATTPGENLRAMLRAARG